jgi:hypothetical protein
VFSLSSCWWTYFVVCGFNKTIRVANAYLLFMKV